MWVYFRMRDMQPSTTTYYLEMRSAKELCPKKCHDDRLRIAEATVRQWQFNRFLYLAVGANWAWNDKKQWTDEQWREYVGSPELRTFVAYYDGAPAGYYELMCRAESGVEIAYFGMLPAFVGGGFGGALLTNALEEAWRMHPPRVWVHTCTLDHPAALANYQARGMAVYKLAGQPT